MNSECLLKMCNLPPQNKLEMKKYIYARFRYTDRLLSEHVPLSAHTRATEVSGASSAPSPALLTWAGTLKWRQRCYEQQSLKLSFCSATGSLISIWKALRWQLKRWIFPVCHCKQVFGAVTWLGLWQEISTTVGQFIPLVSHIYFGMTGLAFRGTYFWLDYKGPGVTSSILLEGIPTRLRCFQVRADAFHSVCYL